jgi:diguanylate cyclase (GGDEF)-like protein
MAEEDRILVVDDEDTVRSVLFQVLSEDGHVVESASNAQQALKIMEREPFALVITDIKMPGMTGLELLEQIKTRYPDTQVIIITSHASLETAISAMRHGAYDYLFKPFEDLDLISAAARRALEKVVLTRENRRLMESLAQKNSQLEKANRILKDLACRDGLTRLYNHRYFQDVINNEIFRAQRNGEVFSLLFVDLDHFKHYNDTHGHLEGDRLLRKIGEILLKAVRRTDIVARYGGEEFVIMLPATPKKNAAVMGEKLRRYIETYPFTGRESQPLKKVTISVGIATFPEDGAQRPELVERADGAMYRAKKLGRNAVWTAKTEDGAGDRPVES